MTSYSRMYSYQWRQSKLKVGGLTLDLSEILTSNKKNYPPPRLRRPWLFIEVVRVSSVIFQIAFQNSILNNNDPPLRVF